MNVLDGRCRCALCQHPIDHPTPERVEGQPHHAWCARRLREDLAAMLTQAEVEVYVIAHMPEDDLPDGVVYGMAEVWLAVRALRIATSRHGIDGARLRVDERGHLVCVLPRFVRHEQRTAIFRTFAAQAGGHHFSGLGFEVVSPTA